MVESCLRNRTVSARLVQTSIDFLQGIERDVNTLNADERKTMRQDKPIADVMHKWLLLQRSKIPDGSATAKAINYSLKRWVALTHYLEDGLVTSHSAAQETKKSIVFRNASRQVDLRC